MLCTVYLCLLMYLIFYVRNTYKQCFFYFLHVIPKATIALFPLASSEVKHGFIIKIPHNISHPVEDTFSCILRYTFLSPNFNLLLNKKRN